MFEHIIWQYVARAWKKNNWLVIPVLRKEGHKISYQILLQPI